MYDVKTSETNQQNLFRISCFFIFFHFACCLNFSSNFRIFYLKCNGQTSLKVSFAMFGLVLKFRNQKVFDKKKHVRSQKNVGIFTVTFFPIQWNEVIGRRLLTGYYYSGTTVDRFSVEQMFYKISKNLKNTSAIEFLSNPFGLVALPVIFPLKKFWIIPWKTIMAEVSLSHGANSCSVTKTEIWHMCFSWDYPVFQSSYSVDNQQTSTSDH